MAPMARHSLTLGPIGILTFSLTTFKKMNQLLPKFAETVIGWPPLKIMFIFSERHQTWPPWPDLV